MVQLINTVDEKQFMPQIMLSLAPRFSPRSAKCFEDERLSTTVWIDQIELIWRGAPVRWNEGGMSSFFQKVLTFAHMRRVECVFDSQGHAQEFLKEFAKDIGSISDTGKLRCIYQVAPKIYEYRVLASKTSKTLGK